MNGVISFIKNSPVSWGKALLVLVIATVTLAVTVLTRYSPGSTIGLVLTLASIVVFFACLAYLSHASDYLGEISINDSKLDERQRMARAEVLTKAYNYFFLVVFAALLYIKYRVHIQAGYELLGNDLDAVFYGLLGGRLILPYYLVVLNRKYRPVFDNSSD